MGSPTGLRCSPAWIAAAVALGALPARDAHAKPLPVRLVRLSKRPSGETPAPPTRAPSCAGEEDGLPSSITVRSRGRTLRVSIEGDTAAVYEGRRLLWRRHVGSAGGANATKACASDGWGVVIAGHYRHGYDVYDLFHGKMLGPGDVVAYAPDFTWGLVPPQLGWATDSCFPIARTFRVSFDGSRRPHALDTPPVRELCADPEPPAGRGTPTPPLVAISPDGRHYAVASPVELALYRASDDRKIARFDHPRFDAGGGRRLNRLTFSRSGRYLVLGRDESLGGPLEDTRWFRIAPRAPR